MLVFDEDPQKLDPEEPKSDGEKNLEKPPEKPPGTLSQEALLLAKIEQLEENIKQLGRNPQGGEPEKKIKKPEEDVPFVDPSLVVAELTGENFNKILKGVYSKAYTDALKDMQEEVAPNMLNKFQYMLSVNSATNDFFNKNDDLIPYREFVGFKAEELMKQNPGWDLQKIFSNLEAEVRKTLRLEKDNNGKHSLADPDSVHIKRPGKKEAINKLQKELDELGPRRKR